MFLLDRKIGKIFEENNPDVKLNIHFVEYIEDFVMKQAYISKQFRKITMNLIDNYRL